MTVFGNYAEFYDLLYQDKDYESEASYVERIIRAHAPATKRILDIGSGTGVHAAQLVKQGFEVQGVDISETMFNRAEKRLKTLTPEMQGRLKFAQADLLDLDLNDQFDAVIALFHVMSYQTSNKDIRKAVFTARQHCKPDGLFIFDFWYGPAVLHEHPGLRVKVIEHDHHQIIRIAEPELFHEDNCVEVNYRMLVLDRKSDSFQEILETHRMRYFFLPELKLLLQAAGFSVLAIQEWMKFSPPEGNSWSTCIVAKAN